MAEYSKTVDPNGGADYTSLSAWEAGEQGLYASGDVAIADCRRTGETKDTTPIDFAGWNAGVIPRITVNTSYRHEGKYADIRSNNNYLYILEIQNTWSRAIKIHTSAVEVYGIVLNGNDLYQVRGVVGYSGYNNCVIANCVFAHFGNLSSDTAAAIDNGYAAGWFIFNNLIIDCLGVGVSLSNYGSGTVLYGNTIYNCYQGILKDGTEFPNELKNNLVIGCVYDYVGTFNTSSSNNISSDATAPGANSLINRLATDIFTDPANGDFSLKAGSPAINAGTDLSAYFTTDILGTARPQGTAWDIGAFEYVEGGGETTISIASASHSQIVTSPGITQVHALSVADGLHSLTSGNATLQQVHALLVADGLHSHEAGSLSLSQVHALAIANGIHVHAADNINLDVGLILAIQDAVHSHLAGNLTLQQVHSLIVANSSHSQSVQNLTMQQVHNLMVDAATHAQTASEVTLDLSVFLDVTSSGHAMSSAALTISQNHLLPIQDAVQAVADSNPSLSQNHVLVVSDALHAQLVAISTLSEISNVLKTPDERIFVILAQDRVFVVSKEDRHFIIH